MSLIQCIFLTRLLSDYLVFKADLNQFIDCGFLMVFVMSKVMNFVDSELSVSVRNPRCKLLLLLFVQSVKVCLGLLAQGRHRQIKFLIKMKVNGYFLFLNLCSFLGCSLYPTKCVKMKSFAVFITISVIVLRGLTEIMGLVLIVAFFFLRLFYYAF